VLPDLDVVALMLLPPGAAAHRGASHSIVAAAGIALCAWALVRLAHPQARFARTFPLLLACALVHPVLDYLMGCGPPVPFLWPLVRTGWLSPIQLVPTAYYGTSASGLLWVVLHPKTWAGIGLEMLSLGPLWAAVRCSRALPRSALLAVSAAGFLLTYLLYN
jgi:membrane-bound metal-dependent hydrolase YbcI (DUF457 family)